ncbi:chitinase-related protein 1 precursor [Danaus plexippus plexippus]|uniref:chitinase n=1 Tax=Danaus plexippus plexippus TaxID=278856 RepID=A0A212EN50_DANPL|nr:chitinase-related protein 1 precursor [Danaus plexippus plexippus]
MFVCVQCSVLWTIVVASPRYPDESPFARSAIETVPDHDPIALPIRSSVESIPLRLLEESEGRLPLRDAVEKPPIPIPDSDSLYKYLKNIEETNEDVENVMQKNNYYGAASYLNNGSRTDEKLQHGNENLEAMQQTNDENARKLVVCYIESQAAYRAPPLAFTGGLVPKSCTHLHYAFAKLHPHTYAVIPGNEDYDVIKGGYRIATGLKGRIPGLKVIISVGGDGTGRLFSEMVQEPYRRNSFIDSALTFLQEHDFDGLDLHWVYAGDKDDKEKELLVTLLYELREKFSSYGYLLSTVLPPFRYQIEDGYDLSAVSGATDYTILQAWDMTHAKRDDPPTRALQHSALQRDPGASGRDQRYDNIEFVVKYILRHGMAADKLVLGIPIFGRSYTLASSAMSSPGAAIDGWGDEGPYTQTKGMLAYFEICMNEREGKGFSEVDEAGNTYYVFENQWISYDTPNTILKKMNFVTMTGLAGAAAWAIDMDDFRGLCGSPFPILSAISTSLNGESTLSDQSSLKVGSCESSMPYLASDQESCAHFHFCTGGINYRMICEDERLYDPSTGFCGHQDVAKCVPGQSLRISVDDAARFLAQAYESDFEWNAKPHSEPSDKDNEEIISSYQSEVKISRGNDKRIICYMTSWAFYRRGDGKFVPEQIDTRLCTHVVYAYASLSHDDLLAKEFDPWADITNNLYERVTSLNDVKVMLGLGGWTDSSGDKYSRLVSSPTARTKFCEKIVNFLRMHNFKGLHLDWNYPVCWQSNCKKGAKSDKANFGIFVKELAKNLHAADMELGVALSGYKEVIESSYDLATISDAVDFMSAMTYDYHGGWERTTSHHTPIRPLKKDYLPYYSIEYAIKALIGGGVDPKKLNLGLAFYGQSFRLTDMESSSGPGSPAAGPGEPGEFTKQPGMLGYYEICYRVKHLRWKTGRQTDAGPYAYSDNQWVGFDDPKSITEKVEWALSQGLGGVTAWAVDLDDFTNRCCLEPSPLLRAAGRALGRSVPSPPSSSCERPPEPVTPAPPSTTPAESDGSIGGGGDHGNHGNHDQHTSTTWPGWNPSSTTQSTLQTWWPQTTTPMTTTSKKPTTTTRRTTTSSTTAEPPLMDPGVEVEGAVCEPGEYHAAADDCEGYLQCESGHWRKHRCAPGLHWSSKANRCDWPSFAKCTPSKPSEASTTTTTLAPMTSRPPPRPTTTRRTTTSSTTTTTTSTAKPTTTPAGDGGASEGGACNGEDYHAVTGDCNSYLHCDGTTWRLQKCAPGLHWSKQQKHCDWPRYANCEGSTSKTTTAAPKPTRPATRPTESTSTTMVAPISGPVEGGECTSTQVYAAATTCDAYLLCVSGTWRKQMCPPGLHWDKRSNRCDWVQFAMCEEKRQEKTTKSPLQNLFTTRKPTTRTTTTTTTTTTTPRTTTITTTTKKPTTTRKPARFTTTKKPSTQSGQYQKPKRCETGTYHAHSRCEKFYVCVNGALIAQNCAPGLVWNTQHSQCDFPSSNSCTDRRQATSEIKPSMMQLVEEKPTLCENGQYASEPTDCTRYLHCLFGKFEQFACSAGLHWNEEKQICDWPSSAKCKAKKVTTTTTTSKPVQMDPIIEDESEVIQPPSKPIIDLIDPNSRPELLNTKYKMICYYTNWSWYRPGLGKFTPEDIDPKFCTHIVYGFAVLGDDGLIKPHDPWADTENGFYERIVSYKKYGAKVSIAIGGWKDSVGDKYSKLVNNAQARNRFVKDVVQFVEKYGFDGLDLDWEYPKCWQVDCSLGPDSDKEGFADLVRELSAVFKPKGLLLSSAVSPSKVVIDAGYDVRVLARHLDWIAVMTYDYHGQWDKKTGHVAPLYYHPEDDNTYFNANYTMHYWMEKGAPASKLVMGIPLYGQTFTTSKVNNRASQALNIPATAGGDAGEYTRANGFLAYYEICERIQNRQWKLIKDPYQRMGPFAYKGNQWVSFDDIDIIKKKVNFMKSLGLAGGMVWAIDLDDFNNRCNQGKYPLMNAIKNAFLDPKIDFESLEPKPLPEPENTLDDDLEDIEVKPSYPKPLTSSSRPISRPATTVKPTTAAAIQHDEEEKFKIVCYYTNWAWYRPSAGKYTPDDIDPSLCTHIVYAFAVLDSRKLVMKPHDNWLDVENKFYEKVVALKSQGVKVVLGLGGWNDSAGDKYSRLVNNPSARRKFIVHAVDFIQQYEFDGLDLDWEYPRCWQVECEKGPSSDKQGFANLVKELRTAFVPRGLLLSSAVSGSKRVIDQAYDVPVLARNLDWIALMTYDYHGQWDKKTGHVAPMYARDGDDDKTFNANFTVSYWISKGAPRQKLVMGVPFYGQSFSLMENSGNGLGAPSYAGGEAGDETRARGFLAFYEICDRIRNQGWKVVRDPGGRIGPYATLSDQWVSFDDDFMIRHKAEYVRAMDLGGAMVWSLDLDDFTGRYCGCGNSPLLSNINHVLRDREAPPPCSLKEIQDSSTPVSTPSTTTNIEVENDSQEDSESGSSGTDEIEGGDLEGKSCSGITFKEDELDCAKYYLCINEQYIQLTCPSPLVWNQNHCDFPEKSNCKSKTSLRLTDVNQKTENENKPIVACYFTNWAYYRKNNGSFGPDQVEPQLCTHIIYSWASLDRETGSVVAGNPELDISNDFYGKLSELKLKGVKIILGVGGIDNSLDDRWSEMAASPERRKHFVKSLLKFLQKWEFDGAQIGWQYQVCRRVPCTTMNVEDKENFSILLAELSKSLRPHNLELSAIVAPYRLVAEVAYNPAVLSATLDWISIAANDYYESETRKTAYLLPLVKSENNDFNNLQDILNFWSSLVPITQIVLGLPSYGRSYALRSELTNGINAFTTGPGRPGFYTRIPGFLAYYEICNEIKSNRWKEVSNSQGTYAYHGLQWTTYLRPLEAQAIGAELRRAGAKGAALWALDLDDWQGTCNCRWPLLNSLRQGLLEPEFHAVCSS